jgi:hypothetical protein
MDPGSYSLAIKSGGNNHYLGMGEDLAGGSDGFNFQIAPWGGTPTTRLGYLEGNFGGSLGFYIRNRRNAPLLLGTNDQERVRITGNGNVGIGTASPGGKLDVDGSIYQRGGVLHADYVFEPDYELESIEEHADYMWQNKHLNSVPEAKIDENGQQILEIGAHRRGILEELEKAHIYIAQLKEILDKQEKRIASLEDNHKPTE